jgi:thiamine-monophosphate kinase
MTFSPRVALARQLAQRHPITAMIDISDGLSRDLAQICRASGVGAVVDAALVPIHNDARQVVSSQHDPLDHALHDGEDHELLFTSPSQSIEGGIRIGRITHDPGLWIEGPGGRHALEPRGWEHRL